MTKEKLPRPRELGVRIGILESGPLDAITDVAGVLVGHANVRNDSRRVFTGVTAVLPHGGNIFREKVPAGIFVGNAFGKLAGALQVMELGNIETPIVLTNTLSVAAGLDGLIEHALSFPENSGLVSINGLVGETNDSRINRIRERAVTRDDVLRAIRSASGGLPEEGCAGAGSGTIAFGWKAGIGTASRVLPPSLGGYTVGSLVQSNFGGILTISGVPIGTILGSRDCGQMTGSADGSVMMIIATDAPLDSRNLQRLAKRAFMGMAKTGGIASNGSGDFAIAFSTEKSLRISHDPAPLSLERRLVLGNGDMSPLFMAAIEATEEAVINSLFAAVDTKRLDGTVCRAIPREKVLQILRERGALEAPCG